MHLVFREISKIAGTNAAYKNAAYFKRSREQRHRKQPNVK